MRILRGVSAALDYLGGNRWWWTFWTAVVAVTLIIQPNWFGVLLLCAYATLAGWHWRERTAIRRLERMEWVTARDLIIKAAGIEYVKLSDLTEKRDGAR